MQRPSMAIIHANVLDVRGGRVIPDATVVIREGRIASVGTGAAPAGLAVVDLRGKYLVPGLIDAHTHLSTIREARTALESGVTTVRSASVGSFRDVALRDLVRANALPGPDMVPAGLFVSPILGADDVLADPAVARLPPRIESEAALRELVRINLAHGVDVVKTRGTERAGLADTDPRKQTYTEAQLRAVVDEAGKKGVPVEAHAHGDEGAQAAVRAGVRSIEHGTYLSDETLRLMQEKGCYLVPTYTTVVDLAEPGGDYDVPALRVRGAHMLPRLRQTVRQAYALGVKIAAGGDTHYGPGSLTRIAHEVTNFVDIGLAPIDAIRSATSTAAQLLGLEKTTGAIETGLDADLIAVERNPLDDIVVLQDPLLVVSNGFVAVDRLSFAKER
jgi:imidazolonepropionase-like amidohydrolase